MLNISNRARELAPSETLAMAARARALRERGIDVISFATGEPDFDTPTFIKEAAKKSLDEGNTKYPLSAGVEVLRKAISQKLERDNHLNYKEDEIVVTCGAKLAIYNALQVLAEQGEEVLIPAPYWCSYPEQVKLAAAKPVIIKTSPKNSFKLTPELLLDAITRHTRAIILNTPSNPSGTAYTSRELKELADVCVEKNIAIISDEIYEKLVYGDFKHSSIVEACPDARDITIIINGVSKSHAMTGWRIGYAAGPKEIISKMTTLLGQQITGIPGFLQDGCAKALNGPQDELEKMRREFEIRRDVMFRLLNEIEGLSCHKPDGAFYLLPNVEAFVGKSFGSTKIQDATGLAQYLLDEGHVATVSGDPFGAPGYIRLSYATSRENIEKGMGKIREVLKRLK